MTRARYQFTGKSHFGKGFVLLLVKFAEHAERFDHAEDSKRREELTRIWFSGACDHLLEMEIPPCFKNTKVERLANKLKSLSFSLRLEARPEGGTEEDIDKAIALVRSIGMEVDKYFGLTPDIGRLG